LIACNSGRDVVLETAVLREHSRPSLRGLGLGIGLDIYGLGLGLGLEGSVSKSFQTSCVRHLCIVRCSPISNWRLRHQMPLSRTSSAMSSSSLYVILWARCTVFQQPPPQWRESLAMAAFLCVPTWWHLHNRARMTDCVLWLNFDICEMQCCFVDTLASVDSFTKIVYWGVLRFCHKHKMMAIVCRVVCDVHIVRIVAVWLFLCVTSKRRTYQSDCRHPVCYRDQAVWCLKSRIGHALVSFTLLLFDTYFKCFA